MDDKKHAEITRAMEGGSINQLVKKGSFSSSIVENPAFTYTNAQTLLRNSPDLESLSFVNCSALTHVGWKNSILADEKYLLPLLRKFILKDCEKLGEVVIEAPCLEELSVTNLPLLKTLEIKTQCLKKLVLEWPTTLRGSTEILSIEKLKAFLGDSVSTLNYLELKNVFINKDVNRVFEQCSILLKLSRWSFFLGDGEVRYISILRRYADEAAVSYKGYDKSRREQFLNETEQRVSIFQKIEAELKKLKSSDKDSQVRNFATELFGKLGEEGVISPTASEIRQAISDAIGSLENIWRDECHENGQYIDVLIKMIASQKPEARCKLVLLLGRIVEGLFKVPETCAMESGQLDEKLSELPTDGDLLNKSLQKTAAIVRSLGSAEGDATDSVVQIGSRSISIPAFRTRRAETVVELVGAASIPGLQMLDTSLRTIQSSPLRIKGFTINSGRHGLFFYEKKDALEKQARFTGVIPAEFILGEAYGEGDCFFDSCAKELNKIFSQEKYTIKSLRLLCHEYAEGLARQYGDGPNQSRNWIAKAFNANSALYQKYLENIQYTVEEQEAKQGDVIWGEPRIDGRIICLVLGVKLHIVELCENLDVNIQEDKKYIISHDLVDDRQLLSVNKKKIDWTDNKIIHLAVCNIHFVPIERKKLRKKGGGESLASSFPSASVNDSVSSAPLLKSPENTEEGRIHNRLEEITGENWSYASKKKYYFIIGKLDVIAKVVEKIKKMRVPYSYGNKRNNTGRKTLKIERAKISMKMLSVSQSAMDLKSPAYTEAFSSSMPRVSASSSASLSETVLVDFDKLILIWAQWWTKKCYTKLEWVNTDGRREYEFRASMMSSSLKKEEDFETVFGKKLFVTLVGLRSGVQKGMENFKRNCRRNETIIHGEDDKVNYKGTRLLRTQLTTDLALEINAEFSVGTGSSNILGTGVNLSRHSEKVSRNTEIKEELILIKSEPVLSDHVCVLEEQFEQHQYVQLVEITGHVVISTLKKINPGDEYTNDGKLRTKWAISVSRVLRDLYSMRKEGYLENEPYLDKFEIDEASGRALFRLNVTEEKIKHYKVKMVLEDEAIREFNDQVSALRLKHIERNKNIRIDRFLHSSLPVSSCSDLLLEHVRRPRYPNMLITAEDILVGIRGNRSHILIEGKRGFGKTTLAHMLAYQWSSDKFADKKKYPFQWVLYLSLDKLNAQRYPKRQDGELPYSVEDIITRECFQEEIFPEIKQLKKVKVVRKQVCRSLWDEELRRLLDTGKILLILDGYDERPKYGELENLVSVMKCFPYVIYTSHADHPEDKSDSGEMTMRVSVGGFTQESTEDYVGVYFGKNKEGMAKMRAYLSRPHSMELSSPFLLESICFLVNGKSSSIDPNAAAEIERIVYEYLLMSFCQRYLSKFIGIAEVVEVVKNERYEFAEGLSLTADRVSELCKFELGFLEYFAFNLLRKNESQGSLDVSQNYMVKTLTQKTGRETEAEWFSQKQLECRVFAQQEIDKVQLNFGFLKESSEISNYYFIHTTFFYYFAARYLAYCLQTVYNPDKHRKVCDFQHVWDNEGQDIEVYVKQTMMLPSCKPILDFIKDILDTNGDVQTNKRLEQLINDRTFFEQNTVLTFKAKLKKMLLPPPPVPQYVFELSRENEGLFIRCKSSTDRKRAYTLGALFGALESFLEQNGFTEEAVKLYLDTDNDLLTIKSTDVSLLNAIAQCLRIVSAPTLDRMSPTHSFFSGNKVSNLKPHSDIKSDLDQKSVVSCIFQ